MFNIRLLEPVGRVSLKNKTFVINLMIDEVSQSFDKSWIYWNSPINLSSDLVLQGANSSLDRDALKYHIWFEWIFYRQTTKGFETLTKR